MKRETCSGDTASSGLWGIRADPNNVDISTDTQMVLAKGVKDQLGIHSEAL